MPTLINSTQQLSETLTEKTIITELIINGETSDPVAQMKVIENQQLTLNIMVYTSEGNLEEISLIDTDQH